MWRSKGARRGEDPIFALASSCERSLGMVGPARWYILAESAAARGEGRGVGRCLTAADGQTAPVSPAASRVRAWARAVFHARVFLTSSVEACRATRACKGPSDRTVRLAETAVT